MNIYKLLSILFALIFLSSVISYSRNSYKDFFYSAKTIQKDSIYRIEMTLSAFGVESDNFPNISALIDLTNDSSKCDVSYYNPAHRAHTYTLNKEEILQIKKLLYSSDLKKFQPSYIDSMKTDQPSCTIIISTLHHKYQIYDYGLESERTLKDLYKIVFKW